MSRPMPPGREWSSVDREQCAVPADGERGQTRAPAEPLWSFRDLPSPSPGGARAPVERRAGGTVAYEPAHLLNAPRAEPIQRVSYDSKTGEGRVEVTVEEGGEEDRVTLKGTLDSKDVEGLVKLSEVDVAENELVEDGDANKTVKTMRVYGLRASPRRHRLGQLLTYHHALVAKGRGIAFVIAMDVSGAGGPFYYPLGFKDFLQAEETWAELDEKNRRLLAKMERKNTDLEDPELQTFLDQITPSGQTSREVIIEQFIQEAEEQSGVKKRIAKVSMFIPTADLIENSLGMFSSRWTEAAG